MDVLNLEGEVVGVATRQEMRIGRLPHRCVYILVFNKNGEIFIHCIQRSILYKLRSKKIRLTKG